MSIGMVTFGGAAGSAAWKAAEVESCDGQRPRLIRLDLQSGQSKERAMSPRVAMKTMGRAPFIRLSTDAGLRVVQRACQRWSRLIACCRGIPGCGPAAEDGPYLRREQAGARRGN